MVDRIWTDDNPFYLLIVADDERVAEIDLGQQGWLETFKDMLRAPGRWHLVRKETAAIPAMILVREGEQPYYVARHVGSTSVGSGESRETTVYGIGKKRLDGFVERIWLFSNGVFTVGDDVEDLALFLMRGGHL